jgi:hypothetical protein
MTTDVVNLTKLSEFNPDHWPLQIINNERYLIVPEWFVVQAVELAKQEYNKVAAFTS